METLYSQSPCSLLELSIRSIFCGDCEESIERLMQLPPKEAFEAAIIAKNKTVISYRTKYESVWDCWYSAQGVKFFDSRNIISLYNDYSMYSPSCNFIEFEVLHKWKECTDVLMKMHDRYSLIAKKVHEKGLSHSIHHMYKVIYPEKITNTIRDYYSKIDDASFLGELFNSYITEKDESYCDPLQFLELNYSEPNVRNNYSNLLTEIVILSSRSIKYLDDSMDILKRSSHYMRKKLYYLIFSSCLRAKRMASSLKTAAKNRDNCGINKMDFEREALSLDVLVGFRNFIESIFNIKEVINIIEFCNFVPLENVSAVFKRVISSNDDIDKRNKLEYKLEISRISSFLRKKYPSLVISRKLRVEKLLKKIDPTIEGELYNTCSQPVFIKYINESVEKLKNEIREMEMFMRDLPGEVLEKNHEQEQ
ncbi:hypothetical protein [Candidatus Ichthyocystis hellenicum]|uniref:hypothetical protein n=1 Tax=Candidatus Ichthyocystis hellenicum TaxID=1561003 RepID=UPI000B809CE9|nr:hypothetical protein [Candidatus Ichthyocystis hellenicum]